MTILQRVFIRKFSSKETLLNPLNIQILGKSLTAKVFPNLVNSNDNQMSLNRLQMQTLELAREHLESHTIPWKKDRQLLPEISGNSVPNLLGNEGSLKEHFMRMATDLGEEYFKLAFDFLATTPISKPPNKEEMEKLVGKSGWFKWNSLNKNWEEAKEGPTDKAVIFDIETCPRISQFPLFASAYGQSGWYIWIQSDEIYNNSTNQISDLDRLIPLKHPILVIGHHVAFDRARIREEYTLERGNCRFLDTLSMHCAVAGLSSQQRGLWQERKKRRSMIENGEEIFEDSEELEHESPEDQEIAESTEKWGSKSSLNNLSDALQLHCNRKLDKSIRDDILLKSTSSEEIFATLPDILTYCAKDVEATAQLFSVLFPKFLKKSPHPVTFTALLEMGSFVLPIVSEDWQRYIRDCDALYDEATQSIEIELNQAVEETVAKGLKGKNNVKGFFISLVDIENTLKDPWLSQLDWTVDPIRYTKARYLKDGVTYAKGGEPRPIGNLTWTGKPTWFKKLIKAGKLHVTPRTSIVPFLLKLKWKGKVVNLIPDFGWCFERDQISSEAKEEIIKFGDKKFQRIPHPGGRDENVGCLLTKNFLKYFQSGDLSTENKLIEKVLEVNSKFSFWTGYRERIREQFVVKNESLNAALILPTVQPMGTVTRRAVEKTWLTASNAKDKLVGSELKALVKAPEGWCFVGADVDSQELWIGSLLGDAQFGWSGATALGWMNLQGSKSDGTDLHSRTASILGMTRDNAKIFNYGRIYGAGVKYAAQLLLKFNPNLSPTEAAARASELYHATKGRRIANRRDAFVSYAGGTESFMFNQMEAIAKSPISRTPVLSAEISEGLISEHVDDNFITSRVNWVVQSSGVDYLHMLLVAVSYLFKNYKIAGRVALTIHDEVRFLVPEGEKYRAALALQIANLWTRAAFVQAVGVQDLPLSVAFFSAVDIDKVLRKEVHLSCITPSNKQPIPPGHALDIYKLLQNCSSLGTSDQLVPNKFMYNYYAKNNQNVVLNEKKAFNFEEEQKYLTILKKQMKKSDDTTTTTTMTTRNFQSSNAQIFQPKTEEKNEIFNRWKNLTNKHNPTK